MIERVQERFDLKPERLIADTSYGTASILGWMIEEKGIEPHIPVFDKSGRKAGKALRCNWRPFKNARTFINKDSTIRYRARVHDCAACPLKPQCCPNSTVRKVVRSVHETARDIARNVATTVSINVHVMHAARSRCSSPISSPSSSWAVLDFMASTGPGMN